MHVCVTIWTNHPNNGACDYSPYWLDSSVILPSRGLVMCPSQLSYSPKRSKKTLELKLGRFIQSVSWFSRPRLTEKSICMGVWNASFCFAVYDFDIYPFSNLQKCPWNAKISVFSQNWKKMILVFPSYEFQYHLKLAPWYPLTTSRNPALQHQPANFCAKVGQDAPLGGTAVLLNPKQFPWR